MENKNKQISPCYQKITGWLNVHTPSERNVAMHLSYTVKLELLKYFEKFYFYAILCRVMYKVDVINALKRLELV